MSAYTLSPRALQDLKDIWAYTFEHWGAEQADHYLRQITTACENLNDKVVEGRAIDDIRKGYFKYSVQSHILFYRITVMGSIAVIRILHNRMDYERHLD